MATVKITIKNETHAFTLETSPSESIAGVKAEYLDSGKNVGHPNYILLLHKGKELPDEKSLAELGITDGDVLVHIETSVDGGDNIWAAGQDGTVHRLGLEKSLISTSAPKTPQFVPIKSTPGRAFFNQMSVRVNGCSFHVLPSMEGRWNGELATIPAGDEGTQVCSYDLIFRDDEGVWSQRQSRTTINGLTLTQHFWIKPVADGILKIESDDPTLRGADITMQELGTAFVAVTATSKRTGRPIMVEMITIVDSSRRLRTVQRFDESGAFRSVYVMNEARVVDAVSGAMEKYEYDNVF
ncbi:hypothetical protein PybrP1_006864 [[Pythium] brassicae (nom. inval.)]|nr:hypothetical protein PybrP1_006864 [[Pythium] brassicae (nom. inval.)]